MTAISPRAVLCRPGIFPFVGPSSAEGMQTMDQSLVKLCREGKIDYEAAKPYIYERTTHDTIKALRR
jgi:Tfp pilus assembly pilus retraction ATPase PilT